jgi:hypothetical protein
MQLILLFGISSGHRTTRTPSRTIERAPFQKFSATVKTVGIAHFLKKYKTSSQVSAL